MTTARLGIFAAFFFALAVLWTPTAATAASITVSPGESIQAAVDSAQPGDTVVVLPGDYTETHGNSAAVRITKPLKLIAKSKLKKDPPVKVRLLPGPGNTNGVLVEPANPGDPDIDGFRIKGFTVQGFPNNGIFLRYVQNFKIDGNESIDNLENGIWPTLSANGLVKKNVAYGSQDSALWVEASENVRVLKNEFHSSPTGLEITVSKYVDSKKNDIHDNTTGVGLYHPNGASLPPLGGDGYWSFTANHIYNNNYPNNAPPGSMSADLPPGGGVLVLGVDYVNLKKNLIENNNFYGISVIDYCVAVGGSARDCSIPGNEPIVESAPDFNTFVSNTLTNNGTAPPPHALAPYAADITYIMLEPGHINCFAKNTYDTLQAPLYQPFITNSCS